MENPSLEEQFAAVQHMFGWTLKTIGHPVEVKKSDLVNALGGEYVIDAHETEDSFIFSLVSAEEANAN